MPIGSPFYLLPKVKYLLDYSVYSNQEGHFLLLSRLLFNMAPEALLRQEARTRRCMIRLL